MKAGKHMNDDLSDKLKLVGDAVMAAAVLMAVYAAIIYAVIRIVL